MGAVAPTDGAAALASLRTLGERGFISRIVPLLPRRPDVAVGAGDDCAVVSPPAPGEELVLKSDPVEEGRHFLHGDDPALVGRKAIARVFSDFAAMGATPKWALVDFSAPPDTPVFFAERILGGMADLARRHGVAVVGGDTSRGDRIALHVFCAGSVPKGRAMLRSEARPGDLLFVTGTLGGSFRSGRHLSFEPRLAEGEWLRRRAVRCAIDVSDGLSCEAWHLAKASGVSMTLDASSIPVSPAAAECADPLAAALGDGEDFELLFFASPADTSLQADFAAAFPDTPLSLIGRAEERSDAPVLRIARTGEPPQELAETGFDHFG